MNYYRSQGRMLLFRYCCIFKSLLHRIRVVFPITSNESKVHQYRPNDHTLEVLTRFS